MEGLVDKNLMQQIVDHWAKRENSDDGKATITENDVLSLFEVLNGHFISRTGVAAREVIVDVEPKVIDCKECGKMFTSEINLERHKQLHLNQEKLNCKKCDKKFMTEKGLTQHMTKHIEPVSCNLCEKQFSSQDYLDQHIAIHNKQGRYGKTY